MEDSGDIGNSQYEFERRTLEVLREPMETGVITVSRAARKITYPARFQLVGAMNPCACGYLGHPSGRCHCTPEQAARYAGRISGPLLERIDLILDVPALSAWELQHAPSGESSAQMRARVSNAAACQDERQGCSNARLSGAALQPQAVLDKAGQRLLQQAVSRFALSARATHRVIRVARTIADLDGAAAISDAALGEALSYRGTPGG